MDFAALYKRLHAIENSVNEAKKEKKVDEEDTQEGNEFSGELAKAKATGKKDFEVDGKKYPVKESDDKDADDEKSDDTDLEESEDEEEKDDDDKETIEESELKEKAAPGQEDWIKSNKDKFIKQYGKKKGMEVLYATSWKRSKKNESIDRLEECYGQAMMGGEQEQESGMNINASTDTRTGSKSLTVTAQGQAAEQLAQLLKLSGLGSGQAPEQEPMGEEYANEPHPETQSVEVQMQQGNDMHRPKNSYPKVSGGDNPMAMRENELRDIEKRLNEALSEIKVMSEAKGKKPDFLDVDKDGNKKEPMKKALADKGKKPVKESGKPDFLDMDKDGNKKEPMKKALADKGKAKAKK